jgi:DNA polymerase-3 subunit epsilon
MTLQPIADRIARRLELTRPLVCFDLESTGQAPETSRIVQVALIKISPDGTVERWESLVNPEQAIPSVATEIHGISDEMVADAPTFAQLASTLTRFFVNSDVTGYNVKRFDLKLLSAESNRVGIASPISADAAVVDAYRVWTKAEPRTLDDALRHYELDDAASAKKLHNAAYDAEASLWVLAAQLDRYELPPDVDKIDQLLFPRDPSWLDADGKLIWQDGVVALAFGKHRGRTLEDLACHDADYLRWMLDRDFPGDVLEIVRAALDGRFPKRERKD